MGYRPGTVRIAGTNSAQRLSPIAHGRDGVRKPSL
jgi:hypothetical protein